MPKNLILGIDPGISGGFACLKPSGECVEVQAIKKMTEKDIVSALAVFAEQVEMAFLEKVASHPKQGVVSVFTFGKNYGMYLGVLAALQIPVTHVPPGVWQRNLGCLSKGDKNVTKRKAQEIFPRLSCPVTHAIADALLIAEYGRRQRLI